MSDDVKDQNGVPGVESGQSAQVTPDIYIPVSTSNPNQGTFGSIVLVDGAGAHHLLEGQFLASDDNVVWLYYLKVSQTGLPLFEHTIVLGTTFDYSDPAYWKMDGFMVTVSGTGLVIRLRGHQSGQPQGCGQATYSLAGVWTPVPGAPPA